jgi:hypothetical protein
MQSVAYDMCWLVSIFNTVLGYYKTEMRLLKD